jgi:hypothetical protein
MKDKLTNMWKWCRHEKRSMWFEYALLSFIIILPFLLPGYILTLDLVFTPHFSWPTELTNTYPLEALLWLLHFILPGDVIEKIILFLILLLSGVGMHRLLQSIKVKEGIAPEIWKIAIYFGGIFYMINPFTYSRFMAGQWMVLLGYALLPFFIQAFIRLLALPSGKQAIVTALLAFSIVSVSLHHVGMLLIVGLVIVIMASMLRYWRNSEHVRKFFLWALASVGIVAVLSSFWLIPTFLGQNSTAQAVTHFNESHFKAFETNGGGVIGATAQVVRLQGFWVEARGLYSLPQSLVPFWGLIFLILWVLVIIGAIKAWRRNRMLVGIAVSLVVLGIILAATPLLELLAKVLPLVGGYREPQKFVNLIAIGYAILGSFGAAYMIQWGAKKFSELGGQVVTVVCLFLPLAITPTMLWGFSGQLTPRAYPVGWYEMNQELKNQGSDKKTLFLPWHQYAKFNFSGRIIANPAEKFFETPIIVSNDPEFKNVQPTVPDDNKSKIAATLDDPKKLAGVLREQNIEYILLAKENDAENYNYLNSDSSFKLIKENNDLKLYKVES